MFGVLFLVPFYLERAVGLGSGRAGIELMAMPVALGITAPFAGRLADRIGARPLTVGGMVTVAGGLVTLAFLLPTTGPFVVLLAVVGIGMGAFTPPNNATIMGSVPPSQAGVASGVLNMTRGMGPHWAWQSPGWSSTSQVAVQPPRRRLRTPSRPPASCWRPLLAPLASSHSRQRAEVPPSPSSSWPNDAATGDPPTPGIARDPHTGRRRGGRDQRRHGELGTGQSATGALIAIAFGIGLVRAPRGLRRGATPRSQERTHPLEGLPGGG